MQRTDKSSPPMPVLFLGHGNPMNAIQDNPFTRQLRETGKEMKRLNPKAALVVSAHWLTDGTFVSTNAKPETIYDFYGFPDELYQVVYPAPGSPEFAGKTLKLLTEASGDGEWGLDHGAWSVLRHLFPDADIPAFQLGIDFYKPMKHHFHLAKKIRSLRDEGVLIIGSGNIVHNLQKIVWKDGAAFDWARKFDEWVMKKIAERDFDSLIDYEKAGEPALLSVPTTDHYIPLLYCLALAEPDESITSIYDELTYGSLSMRCLKIG